MHDLGFAETAQALGVFGLGQMAAAGRITNGFAGGGDFKPLGHGFLGFDAFGTSHKNSFYRKRARNLSCRAAESKREIFRISVARDLETVRRHQ